jgi:FHS family L-fucose permease-like MFS transporter
MAAIDKERADANAGTDLPDLRIFVFALFFIFGGITSLNDVVIPKLKELFTLSHADGMLVQSAFFALLSYFLAASRQHRPAGRVSAHGIHWVAH